MFFFIETDKNLHYGFITSKKLSLLKHVLNLDYTPNIVAVYFSL